MEGRVLPFLTLAVVVAFLMMGGAYARTPQKLFVFGDSFVDAGHMERHSAHNVTASWRRPYGITFPKKPSGRFSDGRVFTDYMASFLGMRSPVPYSKRRHHEKMLRNGMNFAVGTSSVLGNTSTGGSLMEQIDQFEEQIKEKVFTKCDLESSLALVSVSGNDFLKLYDPHYSVQRATIGMYNLGLTVLNQTKLELKRLHDLGVRKVAVMGMPPVGCTPYISFDTLYQTCDVIYNAFAYTQNSQLIDAVRELKNTTGSDAFFYIDIYDAFMTVIDDSQADGTFGNPLEPCCKASKNGLDSCGAVNDDGIRMYDLCRKPKHRFFWDSMHPTQAAWNAIFDTLQPALSSITSN